MGEDQPSPMSFRSKRQRSLGEASDNEPKRNKRHHHCHRHHRKHGRYRDKEEDVANFTEKRLKHVSLVKPVDYEREEGEILEEKMRQVEGKRLDWLWKQILKLNLGEIRMDPESPVPKEDTLTSIQMTTYINSNEAETYLDKAKKTKT